MHCEGAILRIIKNTNVNSTKKNSKTIYPSLEDEKKDEAEDKSQIGYFKNK